MVSTKSASAMQRLREAGPIVLPSLLMCDFGDLKREIARLEEAGVEALHLDVMDGHFVPNLTYGMPIVEGIRKLTDLPLDVHLMMSDPGGYVRSFVEAGSDCLTIHAEIKHDYGEVLEEIRGHGIGAGLAINPLTPVDDVLPALELCDLLLVMSVNAGFGGQSFNRVALEKLKAVKRERPELLLEVDGGVNLSTIADCSEAGASLFVVGSAIFGQSDYRLAIEQLNAAVTRTS